jgi:3-deoxy-D-arabino-heptulosonate 7-phosphate (DAHP) synthase
MEPRQNPESPASRRIPDCYNELIECNCDSRNNCLGWKNYLKNPTLSDRSLFVRQRQLFAFVRALKEVSDMKFSTATDILDMCVIISYMYYRAKITGTQRSRHLLCCHAYQIGIINKHSYLRDALHASLMLMLRHAFLFLGLRFPHLFFYLLGGLYCLFL